jgi:hypothetical protein
MEHQQCDQEKVVQNLIEDIGNEKMNVSAWPTQEIPGKTA